MRSLPKLLILTQLQQPQRLAIWDNWLSPGRKSLHFVVGRARLLRAHFNGTRHPARDGIAAARNGRAKPKPRCWPAIAISSASGGIEAARNGRAMPARQDVASAIAAGIQRVWQKSRLRDVAFLDRLLCRSV